MGKHRRVRHHYFSRCRRQLAAVHAAHAVLQARYAALETRYAALESDYDRAFRELMACETQPVASLVGPPPEAPLRRFVVGADPSGGGSVVVVEAVDSPTPAESGDVRVLSGAWGSSTVFDPECMMCRTARRPGGVQEAFAISGTSG